MRTKTFTLTLLMLTAALPIAAQPQTATAETQRAVESLEISDHTVFGTDEVVDGATILVRDFVHQQVRASVSTQALETNTAYSIWWAVFNRPQYCGQPYSCTTRDLEVFGGDPRVRASVFYAGGFLSDDFGTANYSMTLIPGRTTRELFAQTKAYGLRNLRTAEIHVVLRSHGPTGVAGKVSEQIGTATLACPEDGCQNVFASVHVPNID
ncbi:MAG: hypothetical protein AAGK22_10375 [Acidobacteriota bacterium]